MVEGKETIIEIITEYSIQFYLMESQPHDGTSFINYKFINLNYKSPSNNPNLALPSTEDLTWASLPSKPPHRMVSQLYHVFIISLYICDIKLLHASS